MPFTLSECNTIQELIDFNRSQSISHDKLHVRSTIMELSSPLIVNISSLIDKYYDFLVKIIKPITLSDIEYLKYKFQPKLLSLEMYGTIELWSAILQINNLTSASQFDIKKVNLFTIDIFDILNEILILEDDEMKKNRLDNSK